MYIYILYVYFGVYRDKGKNGNYCLGFRAGQILKPVMMMVMMIVLVQSIHGSFHK